MSTEDDTEVQTPVEIAEFDQFESGVGDEFRDERYGRVSSGMSAPSIHYINQSGLPDSIIDDVRQNTEIASQIERWSQSLRTGGQEVPQDVFRRNRWNDVQGAFAQMAQCAWVVEHDDVLSTLAEVVEGLSFKKMRFELNDQDQQDMWAQWGRDVDLDSRLREMFREEFKVSQFYLGIWWESRVYNVRDSAVTEVLDEVEAVTAAKAAKAAGQDAPPAPTGRQGNRKRKKKFPVVVPTAFTIFDPIKIMPVGNTMFGRERFAYIATKDEHQAFGSVMSGDVADPTVAQLIEGRYNPTGLDRAECGKVGVDPDMLWLLKPDAVVRHTLTRASYERFAAVRLKAVLPIVEIKAHLRASDRSTLIGSTNYIVLIKKGSDKLPARQPEIDNLREQARTVARLPVLVGDHRLSVEIVTPKTDNTLTESRWAVLDSRLVFKALQTFQPIVQGGQSTGSVKEMSQVVAAGLENRRHMLIRFLERAVFAKIMERNVGVLDEFPSLAFAPKRITLDFNADIMNGILKLRDRGDVSRETTLDEFDYDQDVEVVRRAREKVAYDDVFSSSTPYSSPTQNPYGSQQEGLADGTTPEGGRPPGATDTEPRTPAGQVRA